MAIQSGGDAADKSKEFQDRATALALNPRLATTPDDIRALRAVYTTNLPKTTEWGKDVSPEGMFLLAKAASQTGLDPMLGHLVMLGGKITVSLVGIMHVANNDEHYEGFECEPLTEEERKLYKIPDYEHAFKCLTYRSDRKLPIPGIGRASKDNVKAAPMQTWLIEMAQKRAIERSHRLAFNLPFLGSDEPDDEHHMKVAHPVDDHAPAVGDSVVLEIDELYDELRFSVAKRRIYNGKYPDHAELLAVLRKERDEARGGRKGGRGTTIDATADPKKETAAGDNATTDAPQTVQSLISELTEDESEVPA